MGFSNNTIIDEQELRTRLQACYESAPDGTGTHISEQFSKGNAFTVLRFKQKDLAPNIEYTSRFVSTDDFDVFLAGIDMRYRVALGGAGLTYVTAHIRGSVGDAQNDLPVNDNLFLTQPISNVSGEVKSTGGEVIRDRMYLVYDKSGSATQHGARYGSYLLNENNPCNTLLKGASYDVTIKALDNPAVVGNSHTVNFFVVLKSKLRRN